ncbi:MAG: hypothetical protein QXG13_06625 [Zestosphaera sp.]
MYKYYLESLSLFKLERISSLSDLVRRFSHSLKNLACKFSSFIALLENLVSSRVFKMIENKSEKDQKKLVEYVFTAHKVLLGFSLIALYFLTS